MEAVQRLRQSQFLRHNTVFFFGSLAVGVLNYLYYPVIGRLMPPSAFGEVQTIISLFLQLTVFLAALSIATVNIVANTDNEAVRNLLVHGFEKLAIGAGLILLALTIVFQEPLREFLQFESSMPFILLAVAIILTVPLTLRGAFLRGKKQFGRVSLSGIVSSAGKLLFSLVFVIAGLGTVGAIGGLALAQFAACMLVIWWAFKAGLRSDGIGRLRLPDLRLMAPELRFGLLILIGSLSITVLYSIDILIVKHYFDAQTAGVYAGIAAIARIIFFLTASISQVLLPSVRLRNPAGENRQLLVKSFVLFGLISVPTLAIFMVFPGQIIELLMGSSYGALADILPRLSLAIFFLAILNLFVSYYLALRRRGAVAVTALGALLTYALMLTNHATIGGVVNGLLIGSALTLGLLALWSGGIKGKERVA
jgi:O-antigen/teichoic acid export membrane protein